MKRIILVSTIVTLLTSCSTNKNDVTGVWLLTEWNVAGGFDINKDGIINTNILNEIDCVNSESLVFESTGVVASNHTFNPTIDIALVNGTSNSYVFNVECDEEGVISFASTYTVNGDKILINDILVTKNDNKISRVFLNAIKIYNEDFTEVLETKDLTLIYTKTEQ